MAEEQKELTPEEKTAAFLASLPKIGEAYELPPHTIKGKVAACRFIEKEGAFKVLLDYKGADGNQHQSWFALGELIKSAPADPLVGAPDPAAAA